ncbi:glycosyltransferase family 2 protein [Pontibacter lucknowensis]|uniref:Glycosyltransferase involved in cell wall bisynthesis n=1 Tax=Pontibacter lucknowensis TaxID=1077936 RepID=A0A1N6ZBN0_9BACT|nr:glycosyltransferase family 2 protein [Pontibacter lucknowensis]SIR24198.1 Glycosyltransferase involved in cell wall bisynthesis [Pontibacter lucknowensis]
MPRISVIIPAYNEEKSITHVISDIPAELVQEVIVVNNNSSDSTSEVARAAGATVLHEPRPGYGNACLTGIAYTANKPTQEQPDIIVFLDGDYSDYPGELPQVIQPILDGKADLVIGSRVLGQREAGALMPQQIFGNWLATTLLRWLYGVRYTDLGPFRAIRFSTLQQLGMRDRNYGWTVEMQARAAKQKVRYAEVPVNYRKRIGVSKVSGTVKGSVLAGYKIILTIFKLL